MSRKIVLEAIWKVPALRLAAARGTLGHEEVTDETSSRRSSAPMCRSSSTSGRPGAGRAGRSTRSSRTSNASMPAAPLRQAEHRRELRHVARYKVLSIPTAILFADGEAQETVIGARPRSHFERAWEPWFALPPRDGRGPVLPVGRTLETCMRGSSTMQTMSATRFAITTTKR